MKNRKLRLTAACAALAALLLLFARNTEPPRERPIAKENRDNFSALLADLVAAYESPSETDGQTIAADLAAIRAVDRRDHAVAEAIASHWRTVYLESEYTLYCYHGGGAAPELAGTDIPNRRDHAFVVLGYALQDGQMQPELIGRCEAAAAAARAYPNAILVCTGGATGGNNPAHHTEAALMKDYLVRQCGIDAARIFTEEQAMTTGENAVNTLAILAGKGVRTMTVVTSDYHQRWGQALYNLAAALRDGERIRLVGNYCLPCSGADSLAASAHRIAARQMAQLLGLS